jgi:hypothetical protein
MLPQVCIRFAGLTMTRGRRYFRKADPMKEVNSYFDRMLELDFYISKRCTGSSIEFARKLQVSRRTLFCRLQDLREVVGRYNIAILFNREENTFQYTEDGNLKMFMELQWVKNVPAERPPHTLQNGANP